MNESIKYKCHWCEHILEHGLHYTLECSNCRNCKISFDAAGKAITYQLFVWDEHHQYSLSKRKYTDFVDLINHEGYRIFSLETPLQFVDGVPQADRMLEKMKTLLLFS